MLPPSSVRQRSSADPDEAVRSTDDDAAASRLSAVNLGYLDDPYVSALYRPKYGESSRKTPLINVGTHHRTYAIDKLVDRFLDRGGGQIVSLGAGSDTRFWRLMSRRDQPPVTRYVEIDFPNMTSLKAQRIARSLHLRTPFSPTSSASSASPSDASIPAEKGYTISVGGARLSSDTYILLPLDLRHSPAETLTTQVLPHLDPAIPTLFLAECVLCYLQPEVGEQIIDWFARTFADCMGVVYEMCGLDGTFGQVMKRNLAARHLTLPGAIFKDPKAQAGRFLRPRQDDDDDAGFDESGGLSLWEIRERVIQPGELERIARLEHLDEIEELRLVLGHYCVAWGTKGRLTGVGLSGRSEAPPSVE